MGPRSLLLLVLSVVSSAQEQTTCTNQDPCLVSCEGCSGLTTIPDPHNCRRFYYCDEDQLLIDDPFDCPDGQVFNSVTHECEIDTEWLDCTPSCPPSPLECHYTCQTNHTYIASLYDCNTFYTCDADGNSGSAQTCPPEEPFFDGQNCQADETLCCHCQSYCYPGDEGRLVADPIDCRKFHVCLEVGLPANSGTCDNGENFDPISRKCSSEVPCRTMCRNVIGTDGCIDPFTCLDEGDFAKCPYKCIQEYYYCSGPSDTYAETFTCYYEYIFDPESKYCTYEDKCSIDE